MKPTIGRIVRFIDYDNVEAPGIITAVHSDTTVSLYVFRFGAGSVTERTSVVYSATTPPSPFSWHWPERA